MITKVVVVVVAAVVVVVVGEPQILSPNRHVFQMFSLKKNELCCSIECKIKVWFCSNETLVGIKQTISVCSGLI